MEIQGDSSIRREWPLGYHQGFSCYTEKSVGFSSSPEEGSEIQADDHGCYKGSSNPSHIW